jgi:alkanesulfonate monooxygenase SsuD/methylene tetrahydromethanopterin reductase-like flavin-dependent oxidoreductase (luciferase family)
MMRPTGLLILLSCFVSCATTSEEAQRKATIHQYKSDEAAKSGFYGVAAEEQRKAADEHHDAVKKAIDEGKPIPAQPQTGDGNPDGGV